jgi:hypothetical protein
VKVWTGEAEPPAGPDAAERDSGGYHSTLILTADGAADDDMERGPDNG